MLVRIPLAFNASLHDRLQRACTQYLGVAEKARDSSAVCLAAVLSRPLQDEHVRVFLDEAQVHMRGSKVELRLGVLKVLCELFKRGKKPGLMFFGSKC